MGYLQRHFRFILLTLTLLVLVNPQLIAQLPVFQKQQNRMIPVQSNVIVIGGSYVGYNVAQQLATALPATHRVLLIEPHSHFHHLFTFPRFSIIPQHEHKAFVPYTGIFSKIPQPHNHAVVRAKVLKVDSNFVNLDRPWHGQTSIPFSYLVLATGCRLPAPGNVASEEKAGGIDYFRKLQTTVKDAQRIAIIGGGAVGVQMACDIKEVYPDKQVTLIHSRRNVMSRFDTRLHDIIEERARELGIDLVLGKRVAIPIEGYPKAGPYNVILQDGTAIPTDLAITATGLTPNSGLLSDLSPSLINPANGFVKVRPTLQFQGEQFDNMFALGDIADSGANKAARPGMQQGEVVTSNILAMIEGRDLAAKVAVDPPAIHLSLGLEKNVVFRNPTSSSEEPKIIHRIDGIQDMGVERQWVNRGIVVDTDEGYYS